jgi:ankyrin repeat protein
MTQQQGAEELQVIFHAVAKSRTDIVQQAISNLREQMVASAVASLISTGRAVDGATPLHLAVAVGNADVIRTLLNAGASPTAETVRGERPYEWAQADSAKQAFEVFLYESVAVGKVGVIEQLLAGGVPTTLTLVDGSPMLCVAASFGNIPVTRTLLAQGCSVDGVNSEGQTALHVACKEDNAQLIQILLDEGSAADAVDVHNRTPLDLLPATSPAPVREMLLNPPVPTYPCSVTLQRSLESALQSLGGEEAGGGGGGGGVIGAIGLQSASIDSSHSAAAQGALHGRGGIAAPAAAGHAAAPSVLFAEEDEQFFEEDDAAAASSDGTDAFNGSAVKLVLWPAPQRQWRRTRDLPFVLSSQETTSIGADAALADTVSMLVSVFDEFSLPTECVPASASADIRLSVDRHLCPGWNRFELNIEARRVQITASDALGLRYGVRCLVQVIKLHSTLSRGAGDASLLSVPSLLVSDWPDVENRALLWSCRRGAENSSHELQTVTRLMSECRLNMMFLVIDPDTVGSGFDVVSARFPLLPSFVLFAAFPHHHLFSPLPTPANLPSLQPCWSAIQDLEERCNKDFIQLVPTITFTSLQQQFPAEAVKLFSHGMVQIVLLLEERNVGAEVMQSEVESQYAAAEREGRGQPAEEERGSPREHVITALDVDLAARSFCANIMASVQEAGFTTVTLFCSPWCRRVAQPAEVAIRLGMECVERPVGLVFPSQLFIKPIASSPEFIRVVAASLARSLQMTNSVAVLPAFLDCEFMVPMLVLKFLLFLHGGFCWNYSTTMDMLWVVDEEGRESTAEARTEAAADEDESEEVAVGGGEEEGRSGPNKPLGRFDASIIRDVMSLLLFQPPPSSSPSGAPDAAQAAIISLLTGELFSQHEASEAVALARVERVMWALLTSPSSVDDILVPLKSDAALCLKYYKRLLNAAKWSASAVTKPVQTSAWPWGKPVDSNGPSLEVDELLSCVHLLSVLAKAIVFAHTTHEKTMQQQQKVDGSASHLSLRAALAVLPPGTNSDVANSLLEALERCVGIWKRRFRSLFIFEHNQQHGNERLVPFRQARARFFRGQLHGLPTMAFLGTKGGIRDKLPRPTVVDDTFSRVLGGQ